MKRTNRVISVYADSEFRKERTLQRRVRIGRAICNGTLGESNSKLLLHGNYDPEDSDPDKVLAATDPRRFDPFVQVVDPDPESIEPIEPSEE